MSALSPLAVAFAGSASAAVGQLFLKLAARRPATSVATMYLRPAMLAGYVMILLSTVLNTWAYRTVPAKAIAVFLRERLTGRQCVGLALILAGTAGFA